MKKGIFTIKHFEEVGSTNNIAKDEELFTSITASTQTGGRGRQTKSFFSPAGGVYMSAVLPKTDLATIRAGVAVSRSIERLSEDKITIKWVNDIFSRGKKVGGILCEQGRNGIVCGIGININRTEFPRDISDLAGSVTLKVSNEVLIEGILTELAKVWELEKEQVLTEYKSRLFMLGKPVEYLKNGEKRSGTAFDINDEGNLLVSAGDSVDVLNSGEISLGSSSFSERD